MLKIKIKDTNICSFGCGGVETIEHIFWTYQYIFKLWEDLNSWIFEKKEIELTLNIDFGFVWYFNKRQIKMI